MKRSIVCPKCHFETCGKCMNKFIMGLDDINPKCMNCSMQWDFEFVAQNSNKDFYNKSYLQRRAQLVLERERSLLPATQYLVLEEKKRIERNRKVKEINDKIRRAREIIKILQKKKNRIMYGTDEKEEKEEREATFIGYCPVEECKGFLNTEYTCGLCEEKACKKCRRTKHEGKCNPDDVETMKLLKKDTKPCPNCSVPIFKIEGCDQMWCTKCHTTFSWKKGTIVKGGSIHNPHYYQFMRETKGGVPRQVGDMRGNPCGMVNIWTLKCYDRDTLYWIQNSDRLVRHIEEVVLPRYNTENITYEDLRVKYLMNKLNDDRWLFTLKKREKKRERYKSIHLVFMMFVDAMKDFYTRLKNPEVINEMKLLLEYVNKQFKVIGQRFNNKVPNITETWILKEPCN